MSSWSDAMCSRHTLNYKKGSTYYWSLGIPWPELGGFLLIILIQGSLNYGAPLEISPRITIPWYIELGSCTCLEIQMQSMLGDQNASAAAQYNVWRRSAAEITGSPSRTVSFSYTGEVTTVQGSSSSQFGTCCINTCCCLWRRPQLHFHYSFNAVLFPQCILGGLYFVRESESC